MIGLGAKKFASLALIQVFFGLVFFGCGKTNPIDTTQPQPWENQAAPTQAVTPEDLQRDAELEAEQGGSTRISPEAPEWDPSMDLTQFPYGYELVVIINKAPEGSHPTAQKMRVFSYQNSSKGELLAEWLTSTGAEKSAINKLGRKTPRITPVGYYPIRIKVNTRSDCGFTSEADLDTVYPGVSYYSQSWEAWMPWSIFFERCRGYAIHETHSDFYADLGYRVSGGCVRLTGVNAQQLMIWLETVGTGWVADIDRQNGRPKTDSSGRILRMHAYKMLVIVKDSRD